MKIFLTTFLITVGVGLTLLADIFLKKSNGHDWRLIAMGFCLYGLVAFPVAVVFTQTQEIGKLFLIWESVVIIVGMAIASFYFNESFTAYKAAALVMVLIALYLSYK